MRIGLIVGIRPRVGTVFMFSNTVWGVSTEIYLGRYQIVNEPCLLHMTIGRWMQVLLSDQPDTETLITSYLLESHSMAISRRCSAFSPQSWTGRVRPPPAVTRARHDRLG
jgi:hypothetical protein